EKSGHVHGDVIPLLARELGVDRQRKHLLGGTLRDRAVARCIAEIRKALLTMERHGVIDLGADALGRKVRAQLVPAADADDVLVKYVSSAFDDVGYANGAPDAGGLEQLR